MAKLGWTRVTRRRAASMMPECVLDRLRRQNDLIVYVVGNDENVRKWVVALPIDFLFTFEMSLFVCKIVKTCTVYAHNFYRDYSNWESKGDNFFFISIRTLNSASVAPNTTRSLILFV